MSGRGTVAFGRFSGGASSGDPGVCRFRATLDGFEGSVPTVGMTVPLSAERDVAVNLDSSLRAWKVSGLYCRQLCTTSDSRQSGSLAHERLQQLSSIGDRSSQE